MSPHATSDSIILTSPTLSAPYHTKDGITIENPGGDVVVSDSVVENVVINSGAVIPETELQVQAKTTSTAAVAAKKTETAKPRRRRDIEDNDDDDEQSVPVPYAFPSQIVARTESMPCHTVTDAECHDLLAMDSPRSLFALVRGANGGNSVVADINRQHDPSAMSQWTVRWYDVQFAETMRLAVPQFKYCKRRSASFDTTFNTVMYKSPYKYDCLLELTVANGGTAFPASSLFCSIDACYDDLTAVDLLLAAGTVTSSRRKKKKPSKCGRPVKPPPTHPINIRCNAVELEVTTNSSHPHEAATTAGARSSRATRRQQQEQQQQQQQAAHSTLSVKEGEQRLSAILNAFSLNFCSYKHDGRQFRMVLHLYGRMNTHDQGEGGAAVPICTLISPEIVVKAKKPIKAPGSKSGNRAGRGAARKRAGSTTPAKRSRSKTSSSTPSRDIKIESVDANATVNVIENMVAPPQEMKSLLEQQLVKGHLSSTGADNTFLTAADIDHQPESKRRRTHNNGCNAEEIFSSGHDNVGCILSSMYYPQLLSSASVTLADVSRLLLQQQQQYHQHQHMDQLQPLYHAPTQYVSAVDQQHVQPIGSHDHSHNIVVSHGHHHQHHHHHHNHSTGMTRVMSMEWDSIFGQQALANSALPTSASSQSLQSLVPPPHQFYGSDSAYAVHNNNDDEQDLIASLSNGASNSSSSSIVCESSCSNDASVGTPTYNSNNGPTWQDVHLAAYFHKGHNAPHGTAAATAATDVEHHHHHHVL